MSFQLRPATPEDAAAISALIAGSIRALGRAHYTGAQIEAALQSAFGLDSQLIEDGTYYVALRAGRLIGCGGWSYRVTLFGSDQVRERDPGRIDPTTGAARIRAFFVDPEYARQGVGRRILEACEGAARRAGFSRFQLMSTLPGLAFYERCGYRAGEPVQYPLGEGLEIEFVPMHKELSGSELSGSEC